MPPSSPIIDLPEYETQFQQRSDDEEQLWEVREIIQEKKHRYLVRWEGFDPETRKPWDPSWVPKHDCTNELIYDWKVTKAKKSHARKKRSHRNDDMEYAPGGARDSGSVHTRSKSRSATAASGKPLSDVDQSKLGLRPVLDKASPIVEIIRPKKRPREAHHHIDPDLSEESGGSEAPTRKKRKVSSPPLRKEDEDEEHSEVPVEVKPRGRVLMLQGDVEDNIPMENEDTVTRYKAPQQDGQYSRSADLASNSDIPSHQDAHGSDEDLEPDPGRRSDPLPSPRDLLKTLSARRKRKASELNDTSSRPSTSRELHPVPTISPSVFRSHRPPDSQISEIETFTSPEKGHDQHRAKRSRHQSEDPGWKDGHILMNDSIENEDELPVDVEAARQHHGEHVGKTHHQQGQPYKVAKRSLDRARASPSTKMYPPSKDVHSSDAGEMEDDVKRGSHFFPADRNEPQIKPSFEELFRSNASESDVQNHSVIKRIPSVSPDTKTDRKHSDHRDSRGVDERGDDADVSSSQAISSYRLPSDQNEEQVFHSSAGYSNDQTHDLAGDKYDIDELSPEDALDMRNATPPVPLSSSGKANFSLEATGPWTQNSQSFPQLAVIKSPTRQLDSALGLLHRKSEEIHALDHERNALREEVGGLQSKLSLAEKRYGEVRTLLDGEKLQWEAEKVALSVDGERLVQLTEENTRIKASNKDLESSNDMFQDLYSRASDSHQRVMAENSALTRDNQILREQATTGVKQAALFWKTQVHTLETELARVRGTAKVLADQAKHTDDDVRHRAALLPMARKETHEALERVELLKDRIRELGRENTALRIEIKNWEDEAMARRKIEAQRDEEEAEEDVLVWMCHWIDAEKQTKCTALLESREKLQEHLYEAGHI